MKNLWDFKEHGQSGIPVSSLFPHMATCVDNMCVVRSMVGEGVDHGAALLQTFTGTSTFIRPSMGSWALYGLGTENQDLPGYVTINPSAPNQLAGGSNEIYRDPMRAYSSSNSGSTWTGADLPLPAAGARGSA